ncbi:SGNH/GDSL hydrolase family protein [Nocardioides mangrovi]|uniref:SGNH/GDSL hydrolase family protein n=1 Tax=Nocardioides mangrovi TaxID=2874580 RepID=A0ABS7UAE4_9ACTN|nr:SGNH/GDSL hydrolase family protein [Nocardioides mangrovi]MBZ5737965.1 SGNH/GDSL hydrolase family protein [Nocardioides mangrovi]
MRRLVPALLLVAAALAGCSDEASPAPAPAPAETTGSPTGAPTQYDQYVAIGDSYTAAPLVPPTDATTICLRSERNYPALLAAAMPGTELTDVSCSGARTRNVIEPQTGATGSVPPQLEAVTARTDLVTIGLGGNDDSLFAGTLGRCMKLGGTDPDGSPCTDHYRGTSTVRDALVDIRGNVAAVVAAVHAKAPDARIVVVGYPQIIPASGSCDDLPLATGDYDLARRINHGLASAVGAGAQLAGVEFLDLWTPSEDHDICAEEPWINGRVTSAQVALAYHPMAIEQQEVARLLMHLLASD